MLIIISVYHWSNNENVYRENEWFAWRRDILVSTQVKIKPFKCIINFKWKRVEKWYAHERIHGWMNEWHRNMLSLKWFTAYNDYMVYTFLMLICITVMEIMINSLLFVINLLSLTTYYMNAMKQIPRHAGKSVYLNGLKASNPLNIPVNFESTTVMPPVLHQPSCIKCHICLLTFGRVWQCHNDIKKVFLIQINFPKEQRMIWKSYFNLKLTDTSYATLAHINPSICGSHLWYSHFFATHRNAFLLCFHKRRWPRGEEDDKGKTTSK